MLQHFGSVNPVEWKKDRRGGKGSRLLRLEEKKRAREREKKVKKASLCYFPLFKGKGE